MGTQDQPREITLGTTRTEAYTDGVFAIAATLLVLDLTTAALGTVDSDASLWQALGRQSDTFISFAVSFLLLSLLWITHLQQFHSIVRVDTPLLWLNNARLLFVVLIPFTTSLNSDYSAYLAGRLLLPINFFAAALMGYLTGVWAASHDGHLVGGGEFEATRAGNVGGLSATILAAATIALAPSFGSAAFLVFLLAQPLAAGLKALWRRRTARPL